MLEMSYNGWDEKKAIRYTYVDENGSEILSRVTLKYDVDGWEAYCRNDGCIDLDQPGTRLHICNLDRFIEMLQELRVKHYELMPEAYDY